MGQRVGWHRDKPGARRRLLAEMAQLARSRRRPLAVVFDGAPEAHFPDGSYYRGVKIFYARPGSDADARIVEIAERERDRRGLVVVTSDHDLAVRVRACGVRVVRSGAFRRELEALAGPAPEGATPEVLDQEAAQWLRYFGVAEDEDAPY